MSEPNEIIRENKKEPLPVEEHAKVAARIDANPDRPKTEALADFGLSVDEWEEAETDLVRRLTEEIQQGSSSTAPIEEQYSLSTRYAKAYSDALKELRQKAAPKKDDDEEATVRILPDTPKNTPLKLLSASNKAAR